MNLYETVIIFKPTGYEKSTEVFYNMCQEFSKTLKIKNEKVGIKKLAYEIASFSEGYYELFTWAGNPEDVAELERCMRIDDNIIKFMTVRKDENPEYELDAYNPAKDAKSEQPAVYNPNSQIDAVDVLLGFADYSKKGVK